MTQSTLTSVRSASSSTRATPRVTDTAQAATLCIPGELALFERKPRGASVVAMDECLLLLLEEQNFTSFMDCLPSLRARVEALRDFAQSQARSPTFTGTLTALEAAGALVAPLRRLPSLPPPPPLGTWATSLYGPPPAVAQTARGRLQTTFTPPLSGSEPGGGVTAAPAPMTARPLHGARVFEQDANGQQAGEAVAGEVVQSSVGFTGMVGASSR